MFQPGAARQAIDVDQVEAFVRAVARRILERHRDIELVTRHGSDPKYEVGDYDIAAGNQAREIGFIALIGMEIKNSILLVDFTNQLRERGMAMDEAIEKAGEIRFMPILLTSATCARAVNTS